MSATLVILLMGVVTFLPRLLGFALSGMRVSAFWLRFLRFVPIAVFAALIAPGIPGELGEVGERSAAAALAALVIWRFGSLWIGIVTGMAGFWLLRLL